MEENTEVNGKMVNNMEKEFISMHKEKKNKVNGQMGKELNGKTKIITMLQNKTNETHQQK